MTLAMTLVIVAMTLVSVHGDDKKVATLATKLQQTLGSAIAVRASGPGKSLSALSPDFLCS